MLLEVFHLLVMVKEEMDQLMVDEEIRNQVETRQPGRASMGIIIRIRMVECEVNNYAGVVVAVVVDTT